MDFVTGIMYVHSWAERALYTVDIATGALTFVRETGISGVSDIAVHNGVVYFMTEFTLSVRNVDICIGMVDVFK